MSKGPKSNIKVGDYFLTNEKCVVKVVEYIDKHCITICFNDGHTKSVSANSLRKGTIKNLYRPSVYGIGYIGEGVYRVSVSGKHTQAYCAWKDMLKRCYGPKTKAGQTAYLSCSVDERWHNFQVFAEWFYQQPNHDKTGFDLDKDLILLGNKIYSPDYCSFVPQQINKLLTDSGATRGECSQGVSLHVVSGKYKATLNKDKYKAEYLGLYETPEEAFTVYKREKEKFVREQAEKYKDVLHPKVYENLMNWSLDDA